MRIVGKSLTVAIAAALLLASCSTSTDVDASAAEPLEATPTEAPEVEETPTQEPTPEVIEATVGDLVTEEEAELLPEGLRAYKMADGTLVVVDDEESLPEAVIDDISAEGSVIGEEIWTRHDGGGGRELVDYIKQKQREVGRGIYRVHPVYGYRTPEDAYAERPTHYWSTSAVPGSAGTYDTREEAVAAAEAVVAEQAEQGRNRVVIVFGE